jgi:hypothetical protein
VSSIFTNGRFQYAVGFENANIKGLKHTGRGCAVSAVKLGCHGRCNTLSSFVATNLLHARVLRELVYKLLYKVAFQCAGVKENIVH